MMALLNKKNEGGIVSSDTMNITRITMGVGAVIAALTASDRVEWAGFTSSQRLVVVVAVIAAVAAVSVADIIGRALATARTQNLPIRVSSTPRQPKKDLVENTADAIRPRRGMQVRFVGPDAEPITSWQNFDQVELDQKS